MSRICPVFTGGLALIPLLRLIHRLPDGQLQQFPDGHAFGFSFGFQSGNRLVPVLAAKYYLKRLPTAIIRVEIRELYSTNSDLFADLGKYCFGAQVSRI